MRLLQCGILRGGRRTNCVIVTCPMVWKGILAPVAGTPPPPPHRVVSALTHSCCGAGFTFSQICSHGVLTNAADELGCGQRGSLGAGWNWICSTWGQLWVSPHKSHLCALPSFAKPKAPWLGMYPPTASSWGYSLKLLNDRNHQSYLGTSGSITHNVGGIRAAW